MTRSTKDYEFVSHVSKLYFNSPDPNEIKPYHDFHLYHTSLLSQSILFILIFGIFIFLPYYILAFQQNNYSVLLIVAVSLTAILLLLFLLLFFMRISQKNQKVLYTSRTSYEDLLQAMLVIGAAINTGLFLFARIDTPMCSDNYSVFDAFSCNANSKALPADTMIFMMMLPLTLYSAFKTTSLEVICLAWLIVVLFMIAAMIYINSALSAPILYVYIPFSVFLIYELQRQNLTSFRLVTRLKKLLLDRNQLVVDAKEEMRYMIANVAHDLKTPLAAFLNGIEFIRNVLESFEKKMGEKELPRAVDSLSNTIYEGVKDISESLNSIRNIHKLMTMTINRCIDYSKSSNGIALIPSLEAVDLWTCLQQSLDVLRDLQEKVEIKMEIDSAPIVLRSEEGRTFSTDRLWLQENFFCLLSNAVKYTTNTANTGPKEVQVRFYLDDGDNYKGFPNPVIVDDRNVKPGASEFNATLNPTGLGSIGQENKSWLGTTPSIHLIIGETESNSFVQSSLSVDIENNLPSPRPTSQSNSRSFNSSFLPMAQSKRGHFLPRLHSGNNSYTSTNRSLKMFDYSNRIEPPSSQINAENKPLMNYPMMYRQMSKRTDASNSTYSVISYQSLLSMNGISNPNLTGPNATERVGHENDNNPMATLTPPSNRNSPLGDHLGQVRILETQNESEDEDLTPVVSRKDSNQTNNVAMDRYSLPSIAYDKLFREAISRDNSPILEDSRNKESRDEDNKPSSNPQSIVSSSGKSSDQIQPLMQNNMLEMDSKPSSSVTDTSSNAFKNPTPLTNTTNMWDRVSTAFVQRVTPRSASPSPRLDELQMNSSSRDEELGQLHANYPTVSSNLYSPGVAIEQLSYSHHSEQAAALHIESDDPDELSENVLVTAKFKEKPKTVKSLSVASVSSILFERKSKRRLSSDLMHQDDESLVNSMAGHYLRIEVEDNGSGIPPETIHTLFKPYRQSSRTTGGTGLGLFCLANRVKALNGYCGWRPREGRVGSIFWFAIPYTTFTKASSESVFSIPGNDTTTRPVSAAQRMFSASMESLGSSSSSSHLDRLEKISKAELKPISMSPTLQQNPKIENFLTPESGSNQSIHRSLYENDIVPFDDLEKFHTPKVVRSSNPQEIGDMTMLSVSPSPDIAHAKTALHRNIRSVPSMTLPSTISDDRNNLISHSLTGKPEAEDPDYTFGSVLLDSRSDSSNKAPTVVGGVGYQKGVGRERGSSIGTQYEDYMRVEGAVQFQESLRGTPEPSRGSELDSKNNIVRSRSNSSTLNDDPQGLITTPSVIKKVSSKRPPISPRPPHLLPPVHYSTSSHTRGIPTNVVMRSESSESDPGRPLHEFNRENKQSTSSLETVIVHSSTLRPLSILLVEDSMAISKMATKLLKVAGHKVTVAENGLEAIQKLGIISMDQGSVDLSEPKRIESEDLFDLILMDLQMPVMDGFEATRRIRMNEMKSSGDDIGNSSSHMTISSPGSLGSQGNRSQLIIGFSANSDAKTRQMALDVGVDDFIPKPFHLSTFNDICMQYKSRFLL